MTKSQIAAAKLQVMAAFPAATKLEYHSVTDSISGCGWQLTRGQHALRELDRYGNGRFVLAQKDGRGDWEMKY